MSVGGVTKQEFDKAVNKIGEYLHKFSGNKTSFTEDTSNPANFFASATVKHLNITTQVIVVAFDKKSIDVIFNSAAVKIPNQNLVAFFRQLLAWNYVATGMAHYALSESTNITSLILRRPFEGFDYSEFKDAIENISNTNVNGLILLRSKFPV
jgi:hypothetical protein